MASDITSQANRYRAQVFLEQLRLLYSGLPLALGISFVVATVIVIVQWREVAPGILLAWYGAMVATIALRTLTGWRFSRATDPATQARRWYGLFFGGTFAGGVLWATPAFWRFREYAFSQQNFILLMMVGMCAGAATTLSYRRETVLAFVLPILGAAIWRLLAEGTLADNALAGGAGLYLLGLVLSARHIHRIALQNILLRLEAADQQRLLRHSEQRLHFLLDAAADAFFLRDEADRIVDVNREACRSLGYSRAELLSLSCPDIVHWSADREPAWNLLDSRHPLTIEGLHRRKDGTTFPVELRLSVFEEGGHRYFPVLARDTTERQQAQNRIKASEERARAQYKGIPVPTYSWKHVDGDFELIDYNDAAESATSGVIARWMGARLSDMYRDQPQVRADMQRCLETRSAINKEMPYHYTTTGRDVQLAVKYAFVPPDLVMVHTEDISERVKAVEDLRHSRARLADAQRIAKLGDWEWNLATGQVDWSEEIYRIFELDPATTAVSQGLFMAAVHPDDMQRAEAISAHAFQGERYFDEELRIITHHGTLKYIHLLGERLGGAEGQPIRMVGTLQDVTDRKLSEISKHDFVSVVSHELRTPLTSIIGSLSILRNKLVQNDADKTEEMLRIADDNSHRLLRLVNELLDASRIEAGKMTFNFETIAIEPLVEQAIHANQGYAASYDVAIALENGLDGGIRVRGDKLRLMQVMDNLISNAIKFSPPSATVRVVIDRTGGRVRIGIQDQGPGVPDEFRGMIFEKFSRSDSSNTRSTGGTGLGLHIAKHIVEQHGGEIGFDSETGQGSTFYVTLPIETQPA